MAGSGEDGDHSMSSTLLPLLPNSSENSSQVCRHGFFMGFSWSDVVVEVKRQLWLAGPLIAVSLLQYFLQVISLMFVGHLGELALSGASMATSFANVSGFSLLLGMGSALDTLCGQAYGAKQYRSLGVHMQRAMIVLLFVSIPLSFLWAFTGEILMILGQNAEISAAAGLYARWLIPSLFAYGLLQCQVRFLQTQNIIWPMLICSGITTLFHTLVCWILVYNSGLGNKGASCATSISYWINVFLLAMYVKFSKSCEHTWVGLTREAMRGIINFIRLAVPSAFMICLEYWSFEMVVLLSGLLPNPKLETSVLSISLNTMWMVYMIPTGLGSAVSIRVSNELGAGNSQAARLAVLAVFIIAITEGLIVALFTILVRDVWGYLYSSEQEVVSYVSAMMPVLAASDFMDGIQCALSGAARGCGWQKICSFINLGAYYVVGIPSAILFAFILHAGGQGLWFGIISALIVQLSVLFVIILRTNWDQEAMKAINRVQDFAINAEAKY
ncbi:multidrug resistance protein MATE family protein [Dioscorea alata]|uniref:Multidrug resistance protein MATE family protein n=2 Tax=Dioscorea alata TaxID=55571 RepID=A0ACB7W5F3_DIOAL|nr:multidrug resistance protein MATE family protein [Dioscorea alata]